MNQHVPKTTTATRSHGGLGFVGFAVAIAIAYFLIVSLMGIVQHPVNAASEPADYKWLAMGVAAIALIGIEAVSQKLGPNRPRKSLLFNTLPGLVLFAALLWMAHWIGSIGAGVS